MFLYVFSEQERDALLELDYKLIKSDDETKVYVFENQDELRFSLNEINAFKSDILSF